MQGEKLYTHPWHKSIMDDDIINPDSNDPFDRAIKQLVKICNQQNDKFTMAKKLADNPNNGSDQSYNDMIDPSNKQISIHNSNDSCPKMQQCDNDKPTMTLNNPQNRSKQQTTSPSQSESLNHDTGIPTSTPTSCSQLPINGSAKPEETIDSLQNKQSELQMQLDEVLKESKLLELKQRRKLECIFEDELDVGANSSIEQRDDEDDELIEFQQVENELRISELNRQLNTIQEKIRMKLYKRLVYKTSEKPSFTSKFKVHNNNHNHNNNQSVNISPSERRGSAQTDESSPPSSAYSDGVPSSSTSPAFDMHANMNNSKINTNALPSVSSGLRHSPQLANLKTITQQDEIYHVENSLERQAKNELNTSNRPKNCLQDPKSIIAQDKVDKIRQDNEQLERKMTVNVMAVSNSPDPNPLIDNKNLKIKPTITTTSNQTNGGVITESDVLRTFSNPLMDDVEQHESDSGGMYTDNYQMTYPSADETSSILQQCYLSTNNYHVMPHSSLNFRNNHLMNDLERIDEDEEFDEQEDYDCETTANHYRNIYEEKISPMLNSTPVKFNYSVLDKQSETNQNNTYLTTATTASITTTTSGHNSFNDPIKDSAQHKSDCSINNKIDIDSINQNTYITINRKTELNRPLTLYLPKPNENIDLIEQVQLLGHDLDLISDELRLSNQIAAGCLWKNSSNNEKNWLKRYFYFDRQAKVLSYYKNESDLVRLLQSTSFGNIISNDNGMSIDDKRRKQNSPMSPLRNEKDVIPKKKTKRQIPFEDIREVYVDHKLSSLLGGAADVVESSPSRGSNNKSRGKKLSPSSLTFGLGDKKASKRKFVFVLSTRLRKYTLAASRPELMRVWVDILFTAAKRSDDDQDDSNNRFDNQQPSCSEDDLTNKYMECKNI